MKISQLLTVYYDPTTNSIIGCEKDGLVYLHEYRHQLQFTSKIGKIYLMIETYLVRVFGSAFILLAFFDSKNRLILFALAGLTLIIPTIVMLYWEIDAWVYAIKKWKK